MSEPVPFITTRWRCPHCPATRSSKTGARRHMARCWYNPAARSCKTCAHYNPDRSDPDVGWEEPESCEAGIDLRAVAVDNQGHPTLPTNCQRWGPQ